ncbi:hypothetical protein [Thermogemmatispora tikiterensis]|uniref:Uncharacterized protein n=1 Tax=Thermogemmatispora tikiterensis TaxID=1825093 RepID=A0A328V8X5_9CHLR|nr:hypothetical protein [Thermogemmatispora tikiterensis]RAQ93998.1 hypothetical protein A4R35_00540 [Thermogemmatispora tikiterensis]
MIPRWLIWLPWDRLSSSAPTPPILSADLASMVTAYQQAGGASFTLQALLIFMLLTKFESIAHHGARFLRGEIAADLVLSQLEKIRMIMLLAQESQKRDFAV